MSFLKVLESIILFIYYYFDKLYKERHKEYNNNYFGSDIIIDLVEINICLFLSIVSLIHNEIIIINFEKLRKNTKYFREIIAEEEIKKLMKKKKILDYY